MNKSEWSGWMQAIGAISAICGAFYISKRQETKQIHLLKKSAVVRVRMFVLSVSVCAENLRDSEEVSDIEIRRQKAVLEEVIAIGRSISAELLNTHWIASLEATRTIAPQLTVLYEAILEDGTRLEKAREIAAKFCGRFEVIEKVVSSNHPGVKFSKEDEADTSKPFFPGT